jgi:hypothetical protein
MSQSSSHLPTFREQVVRSRILAKETMSQTRTFLSRLPQVDETKLDDFEQFLDAVPPPSKLVKPMRQLHSPPSKKVALAVVNSPTSSPSAGRQPHNS